jgi:hypothetical protein
VTVSQGINEAWKFLKQVFNIVQLCIRVVPDKPVRLSNGVRVYVRLG